MTVGDDGLAPAALDVAVLGDTAASAGASCRCWRRALATSASRYASA